MNQDSRLTKFCKGSVIDFRSVHYPKEEKKGSKDKQILLYEVIE